MSTKSRTKFNAEQLYELERLYRFNSKPLKEMMIELGEKYGLELRTIQVWFQNRRMKESKTQQVKDNNTDINDHKIKQELYSAHMSNRTIYNPTTPISRSASNALGSFLMKGMLSNCIEKDLYVNNNNRYRSYATCGRAPNQYNNANDFSNNNNDYYNYNNINEKDTHLNDTNSVDTLIPTYDEAVYGSGYSTPASQIHSNFSTCMDNNNINYNACMNSNINNNMNYNACVDSNVNFSYTYNPNNLQSDMSMNPFLNDFDNMNYNNNNSYYTPHLQQQAQFQSYTNTHTYNPYPRSTHQNPYPTYQ